jgi:hypothetical protein
MKPWLKVMMMKPTIFCLGKPAETPGSLRLLLQKAPRHGGGRAHEEGGGGAREAATGRTGVAASTEDEEAAEWATVACESTRGGPRCRLMGAEAKEATYWADVDTVTVEGATRVTVRDRARRSVAGSAVGADDRDEKIRSFPRTCRC